MVLDERHMELDDLPVGKLMRSLVGLEQSRTRALPGAARYTLSKCISKEATVRIASGATAWRFDCPDR